MGKNIIVSEETLRDLLEAHASLAAWYYELSAGLRAANGAARTPDDATRAAFVERLAVDFPELAAVARAIRVPRIFVPAPPMMASGAPPRSLDEQATLIEPAQARVRGQSVRPEAVAAAVDEGAAAASDVSPPAFVIPSKVKYEP